MAKVVAVGIDGGTLDIIRPMVETGELPNFRKMMQGGSYGILKSLLPTVTCPLWKSYSTGKNYGKLGAFGWIDIDTKAKKMRVNTSGRFARFREIWDYVGDAGMKVGVINMSLSYPPKKVNGFFISGNTPNIEVDYTYPIELKEEITKKYNYKISKSKLNLAVASLEVIKETMEVIKSRFDVAKAKVNSVDFLQVVVYRTDAIMHFSWGTDFVKNIYKLIDKELGELMKKAGKNCDFVVMSDHGFRKIRWFFYPNNWLREKGYLVEKKGAGDVFNKLGISRDTLYEIASKLHLVKLLKKVVPKETVKTIKSWHGEIGGTDTMYLIDWDKSKVVGQSAGMFHILSQGREREAIREKLAKELLELRIPGTNKKAVSGVFRREELYSGGSLDEAPDLVAPPSENVESNGSMGPKVLFSDKHHWKATHAIDGMFFFYGPSFRESNGNEKASILDLMPTILHLMGLAVPTDLDGKVLQQFFADKSDAKARKVKSRTPLPEEEPSIKAEEDSLAQK